MCSDAKGYTKTTYIKTPYLHSFQNFLITSWTSNFRSCIDALYTPGQVPYTCCSLWTYSSQTLTSHTQHDSLSYVNTVKKKKIVYMTQIEVKGLIQLVHIQKHLRSIKVTPLTAAGLEFYRVRRGEVYVYLWSGWSRSFLHL